MTQTVIKRLEMRANSLNRRIRNLAEDDSDGVWRTLPGGRRIFIRKGEGLDIALKRSLGKGGGQSTKKIDLVRIGRIADRWMKDVSRKNHDDVIHMTKTERTTLVDALSKLQGKGVKLTPDFLETVTNGNPNAPSWKVRFGSASAAASKVRDIFADIYWG